MRVRRLNPQPINNDEKENNHEEVCNQDTNRIRSRIRQTQSTRRNRGIVGANQIVPDLGTRRAIHFRIR